MQPRLFSENPITGIRRIFHYDESNDTFTIETQQDVQGVLERNKAVLNAQNAKAARKFDPKQDFHHIASIPLPVYFDLKKKGIVGEDGTIADDKRFRQWLNDPENRFFRTHHGTV